MCSDYGNRVPYSVYVEEFSQLKVPLRVSGAIPKFEPRDDLPADRSGSRHPGRRGWGRAGAAPMGFSAEPPQGAACDQLPIGRRPVREGPVPRARLALLEFTGRTYPKTKWRFTKTGEQ